MACSWLRRWLPVKKTRCVSGSTAKKAEWNGSSRNPIHSSLDGWISRRRFSVRAWDIRNHSHPSQHIIFVLPGGHPEGYLEAFGNIYRNFAQTLTARIDGTKASPESLDFPGVDDGIRGMAFIDSVVASSQSKEKWYDHSIWY